MAWTWWLLACAAPAPVAAPPVPVHAPAAPRPPDPGPAWLGTLGAGLVRVDEGRFTRVDGAPATVERLAEGPVGELWVYGEQALFRVLGARATRVAEVPAPAGLEALAVDAEGRVWGVGFLAAGVLDGGRWRPLPPGAVPDGPLQGVVVDGDVVWVLSRYALHRHALGAWTPLDLTLAAPTLALTDELVRLPDGSLRLTWVDGAGSAAMLAVRHGRVEPAAEPAAVSVEGQSLAVGPDGHLAVARGATVHVVGPGEPRLVTPLTHGYRARGVDALALDGRGRLWLGTDAGLVVVDGEGSVTWPPGGGVDAPILAVHVHGDGPALPPPPPSSSVRVRGRALSANGRPLGDTELALCDHATLGFARHPCEGSHVWRDGRTDADGGFTLDDVPRGLLTLAVREGPTWRLVLGVPVAGAPDGDVTDLGPLRVSAPPGPGEGATDAP